LVSIFSFFLKISVFVFLVAFSLTSTIPPNHLLNLSSATLKRKQVFKLDFVSFFERELNVCQSTFCEIKVFKSPLGDLGGFLISFYL